MNSLKGRISEIEVSGNMSLVSIDVAGLSFKSIVIETPETVEYLVEGGEVLVLFKETEVIIGKGEDLPISLRNKIKGRITDLQKGTLLSRLTLDTVAGKIISIITTNAVDNLDLELQSEVVAMVKTNEILLSPC